MIFDTLNYKAKIPLLPGKNRKVTGLIKNQLGGNVMTKFKTKHVLRQNMLSI